MRTVLFFFTILLFSVSVWAQEVVVQGRVVDAKTGEALPYVSIYAGEGKGTLSNNEGEFKLKVQEGDMLKFSCICYDELTIAANEMPSTMSLTPYTAQMSEVTVQAESVDMILKRIIQNLHRDYDKNKKWTRKYFFRTYSEMNGGSYIAEAFMKAHSVVNIRSASILSGLEGHDTEGNWSSLNMFDSNIHRLIEVGPMIYDSKFWQDAIKPLKSLSTLHRRYKTDLKHMQGEDGKTLYKIEFRWKKKEPSSLYLREIYIVGTAYVDAETYRLLRFDGSCKNCTVYTGEFLPLPTVIDFHLEYDYSQSAASVSHLYIRGGNPLTYYHTLLFAIEPNEEKPEKMKISGENMVIALRRAGFKSKLWKQYDIVKRTKEEERIAFGDEE